MADILRDTKPQLQCKSVRSRWRSVRTALHEGLGAEIGHEEVEKKLRHRKLQRETEKEI